MGQFSLLISNVPTLVLACLSAWLIHDGHGPWVWGWFLLLAGLLGVSPKSKDDA